MTEMTVIDEPAAATVDEADCASHALTDMGARTDVLNRLKRAEGQLRGIQRMIEANEDCMKIAQQFSAVRKALDSTYTRMTVCFVEQQLDSQLPPELAQSPDIKELLSNMETLLARRG
ncbi:MAG: hypothetical protein RJA34_2991 [Pseudomonadota bacterium]|jgi:DNA-binding FrmR family transcriptional regulator